MKVFHNDSEDNELNKRFKHLRFKATFCENCSEAFSTLEEHKNHFEFQHKNAENFDKIVKCDKCENFMTVEKIISHVKDKHTDKKIVVKSIECPICNCKFYGVKQSVNLKNHLYIKHKITDIKPKKQILDVSCICETCSKDFKTPEALKNHVESEHKSMKITTPKVVVKLKEKEKWICRYVIK